MKLDKLLFSAFANASSFAFKFRSILKDTVVSFIRPGEYYTVIEQPIKKYIVTFPLDKQRYDVLLCITT